MALRNLAGMAVWLAEDCAFLEICSLHRLWGSIYFMNDITAICFICRWFVRRSCRSNNLTLRNICCYYHGVLKSWLTELVFLVNLIHLFHPPHVRSLLYQLIKGAGLDQRGLMPHELCGINRLYPIFI